MNQLLRLLRLRTTIVTLCLLFPLIGSGQVITKLSAQGSKMTPDLYLVMQQHQKVTKPGSAARLNATKPPVDGTVEVPGLESVDLTVVVDGKIAIEAIAKEEGGENLLQTLQALGLTDAVQSQRIIFGYLPIDKLAELKDLGGLAFARPSYKPFNNAGRVTSQGDQAMRANVARQTYNVTGAGSRIGVLSDSYNIRGGAASGVASGDLPSAGVFISDEGRRATDEDEGRAMAEIIHDVAPGAAIDFNTAQRGQAGFANGILNLAARGANIIVDDVIYLAEPFFQDGIIAQAVNEVVRNKNVSYFSSAGNNGRQSYQSPFVNSGRPAPGLTLADGVAHVYGEGSILQSLTLAAGGGEFRGVYQWDDPFYSVSGGAGARSDLDVFVYFNGQLLPQFSSFSGNVGGDPVEFISIRNTGPSAVVLQLAIVRYAGPSPSLVKFVDFGGSRVQFATNSGTIYGHANTEGAIATGAAAYFNTPAFNSSLSSARIEGFSSLGGVPILFTSTGRRLSSPIVLQKPEVVGPDGANTTFFFRLSSDPERDGIPNFFGTSASAPHLAAVAALMQERNRNTLSPDNIRTNLIRSAVDMDDPNTVGFDTGFDFLTGHGFVQADRALSFGPPFSVLTPTINCQTNTITLRTANGDGSPVEYFIPGVTPWTSNPVHQIPSQLDANTTTLTIYARQNGQTATLLYYFRDACIQPATPAPGTTFALLAPLFNCGNGQITVRTTIGDGTPIEYFVPGASSWTTNPVMVLEAGAFLDQNTTTLFLYARQSGRIITGTFNFRQYCANLRGAGQPIGTSADDMAANLTIAENPEGELQLSVLENPSQQEQTVVEVRGAWNQPLKLQVVNMLGRKIGETSVESAGLVERVTLPLGQVPGLYLLRASTPTKSAVEKVLKQ